MKQLLTSFIVASAFACLTSSANASLPFEEALSLETPTLISATENPTDAMVAQCYGGGGGYYSSGYAPVYRSSRYYYPQRRGGVSINLGGGGYGRGYGRGFYPGYGGGGFGRGFYGGRGGGFGRSGIGLFLSL